MVIRTERAFSSTDLWTDTMKKAFSLIELLVVIGILAVLMGALVATMSGGTEAARAARCLTNMKNLATACNTRAAAGGSYPLAGSVEKRDVASADEGGVSFTFTEQPGWISWNSRGAYPSTSHVADGSWFTSAYCTDPEERMYALTNGAIWRAVSCNADVYVCPAHRKRFTRFRPVWSYVMNSRFGYDDSLGANPKGARYGGIGYGGLSRADRTLMFAELQFLPNDKVTPRIDSGAGIDADCTLQYKKDEIIGFNHPSGKRALCAHVVFADGHVEKLTIPAKLVAGGSWQVQIDISQIRDLTQWLCEGKDVSFNGERYEQLKD